LRPGQAGLFETLTRRVGCLARRERTGDHLLPPANNPPPDREPGA
jgi:hypothetical protein